MIACRIIDDMQNDKLVSRIIIVIGHPAHIGFYMMIKEYKVREQHPL
jgi:hypothetical protein